MTDLRAKRVALARRSVANACDADLATTSAYRHPDSPDDPPRPLLDVWRTAMAADIMVDDMRADGLCEHGLPLDPNAGWLAREGGCQFPSCAAS